MIARVLTALVGIPVFLVALYFGGIVWAGLMILITVIGTDESGRLVAKQGAAPLRWAGQAIACGLVMHAYIVSGDDPTEWSLPLGPMMLSIGLVLIVNTLWPGQRKSTGLVALGATIASALYPGLFVAHLVALRNIGLFPLLFAVLVTWATDTAAFFVGSAMGRHRLWPSISPNKTVEGAVGGIVGGVVVSSGLAALYGLDIGLWAVIGAMASVAAQFGDLLESGLKRHAGVKDSGALLPGHGGILDRMDSLFFSGTVVYYLVHVMG